MFISGQNEWKVETPPARAARQGPEVDPLAEATPEKVRAFVEGIRSGHFDNQLEQGAENTLSAILGGTAARKSKELTWNQLLKSNQQWKTDVDIQKLAWFDSSCSLCCCLLKGQHEDTMDTKNESRGRRGIQVSRQAANRGRDLFCALDGRDRSPLGLLLRRACVFPWRSAHRRLPRSPV